MNTLPPFKQPAPAAADAARPASRLPLVFGAVALVAIGAAVYFALRPAPAAPVAPAPPPVAKAEPVTPAVPAARGVHDKSVAVLPFTNMSEEKDNAFFTDGVHEDVLTNLALIRELRVVSRTSVQAYRGTTKSMKQIAEELGVTYILEGSVRRVGNKVRVTGQLIHAATDEHVWAQTYDRDLTDIFTIQSELSREIAAAMKAALSPEEKIFLARKPTTNPLAYDRLLQAKEINNREGNSWSARQRRATLLQEAVALDPNFATAWGELADVLAYGAFIGDSDMDAQLNRAKDAIDRAVRLAPDDPEVIASLGTYYYSGYRDYARATEQLQRLAQQLPNSPRFFFSLGLVQRRQGRWAEALVSVRRACELDPANRNYLSVVVSTLITARRWDEALEAQRRFVAIAPDDLQIAYNLAELHYTARGSRREAEQFFAGLSPAQANSPLGIYLRKSWAADLGDNAELIRLWNLQPYFDGRGQPRWEQAFDRASAHYLVGDAAGCKAALGDWPAELRAKVQREPNNPRQLVYLAAIQSMLGEKEEARRNIDRAVQLMPPSRDAVDGASYAFYRAIVYDWTGDKETALQEYTRLLQIPTNTTGLKVQVMRTSYFGSLKGDPRFEALLADPKNNAPLF